ncbi:MAG TPA: hypothetical protein VIJ64_06485 [Candidatus Lustribacter sp.]
MRCSRSPAISIAPEPDARTVATNALSAIVFREILKPLASGLGPVGEVAIDAVADSTFTRLKT